MCPPTAGLGEKGKGHIHSPSVLHRFFKSISRRFQSTALPSESETYGHRSPREVSVSGPKGPVTHKAVSHACEANDRRRKVQFEI